MHGTYFFGCTDDLEDLRECPGVATESFIEHSALDENNWWETKGLYLRTGEIYGYKLQEWLPDPEKGAFHKLVQSAAATEAISSWFSDAELGIAGLLESSGDVDFLAEASLEEIREYMAKKVAEKVVDSASHIASWYSDPDEKSRKEVREAIDNPVLFAQRLEATVEWLESDTFPFVQRNRSPYVHSAWSAPCDSLEEITAILVLDIHT